MTVEDSLFCDSFLPRLDFFFFDFLCVTLGDPESSEVLLSRGFSDFDDGESGWCLRGFDPFSFWSASQSSSSFNYSDRIVGVNVTIRT